MLSKADALASQIRTVDGENRRDGDAEKLLESSIELWIERGSPGNLEEWLDNTLEESLAVFNQTKENSTNINGVLAETRADKTK